MRPRTRQTRVHMATRVTHRNTRTCTHAYTHGPTGMQTRARAEMHICTETQDTCACTHRHMVHARVNTPMGTHGRTHEHLDARARTQRHTRTLTDASRFVRVHPQLSLFDFHPFRETSKPRSLGAAGDLAWHLQGRLHLGGSVSEGGRENVRPSPPWHRAFECRQNLPVAVRDRNSGQTARAQSEQDTPFTPLSEQRTKEPGFLISEVPFEVGGQGRCPVCPSAWGRWLMGISQLSFRANN